MIDVKIDYFRKDGNYFGSKKISLDILEEIDEKYIGIYLKYAIRDLIQKEGFSKEMFAVCNDNKLKEPVLIFPRASTVPTSPLTLQDFRNELQEVSFKTLHHMILTGDTYSNNLVGQLIARLDDDYQTEFQPTKSVLRGVGSQEIEKSDNEQIKLF